METLILDEGITGISYYCLNNLSNLKTLVIKATVDTFKCNTGSSFQNFPSTIENLYCDAKLETMSNKEMTIIKATNKHSVSDWKGM